MKGGSKKRAAREKAIAKGKAVTRKAPVPPDTTEPLQKWTLHRASIEFGIGRENLRKKLAIAGIDYTEGNTLTTLQVHKALAGDLQAEKLLDLQQRREEREKLLAKKLGKLLDRDQVEEAIDKALGPVRKWILDLPENLARKVNPKNPALAKRALEEEVDRALKRIRSEVRRENK